MATDFLNVFRFVHFAALGGLALYGLHRLWLLWHWWPVRQRRDPLPPAMAPFDCPRVTVQLPIYNERFVAARLIDAAARIRWPAEKLEIQVLDDSTDDTRLIIDQQVALYKRAGTAIHIVRRRHRHAYKAGALASGLACANGELIAVFDADFLPGEDFLERTVPYFIDPRIGMVQARWSFLNSDQCWLTRIQALLLGPHFCIEHRVRHHHRLFFNFNGTAGIWRRQAIVSAGGWQADTVTEDLDLSYRAQLAGWRFVYLNDTAVPSELPATLGDFRRQQHRWAKGSIQTARKILPRLLWATLPLKIKIEAIFHLLANVGWLLGALVTLTLYPAILVRAGVGPYQILRLDLPLFIGATLAMMAYFFLYAIDHRRRQSMASLLLLPILTIGLAPSLALAVIQGGYRRGGVFERTPKYGLKAGQRLPALGLRSGRSNAGYLMLNLSVMVYIVLPLVFAWQHRTWMALPLLMVFPLGFALVIVQECHDWWRDRRGRAHLKTAVHKQ